MATHSSILAWRIPWIEEPVGYSPQGGKELDIIQQLNNNNAYHLKCRNTLAIKSLKRFSVVVKMGKIYKVKVKVKSLSCVRLFATPWAVACPRLLHPWDFLGKSTEVGCHFLLQGIFPTQGSNPGLPHCRQMLYCLSHQGSRNPQHPVRGLTKSGVITYKK